MSLTSTSLRAIADQLDALGILDRLPAEFPRYVTRAEELPKLGKQVPDTATEGRQEIVSGLADGRIDLAEATEHLAALAASHFVATEGADILRRAGLAATRRAEKILTRNAERLVTDVLAPRAAALVAETEQVLADLPATVTNAETAIKAGAKASKAWARLDEAANEWGALVGLVKRLRSEGVIAGNPHDADLIYGNANAKVHGSGQDALRLADLIRAGRQPRLITQAQLDAEIAEEEARLRAEHRADLAPARGIGFPRPMTGAEIEAGLEAIYAQAETAIKAQPDA